MKIVFDLKCTRKFLSGEKTENPSLKSLIELPLNKDLSNLETFFVNNEDNVWYCTNWIDLKKPEKKQLEKLLNLKRVFGLVFKAYKRKKCNSKRN